MSKVLITVSGWEERAIKGFVRAFEEHRFDKYFIYEFEEYLDKTIKYKNFVQKYFTKSNIQPEYVSLSYSSSLQTWNSIVKSLSKVESGTDVFLDISTMPREIIWICLFCLKQNHTSVSYIYHSPETYSHDWLSREPDRPRLLFKHSGIMGFDKPTLLFIITGFDPERTRQLINFYEPKKTILLIQQGVQFQNSHRNTEIEHSVENESLTSLEVGRIDAYSNDHGYSEIKNALDLYVDQYNIVATSLGPKLTGISLYRYFIENDQLALAYVPCRQFNLFYSVGIGQSLSGTISLTTI